MKANRFWWREQNKSLKQDCGKTPGCWLPRDHQGKCQPAYERGDYDYFFLSRSFLTAGVHLVLFLICRRTYRTVQHRIQAGLSAGRILVHSDADRRRLPNGHVAMEHWQPIWSFDFPREHKAGTTPDDAAMKANHFWWRQQNKSLKQDCQKTPNCWLPRDHQGKCQSAYERGDCVKVEFPDETTGIGEWMWMIVDHCDDEKRLVFGTLDNEPVNGYDCKIELRSELAVSYENIRDHRKAADFRSEN